MGSPIKGVTSPQNNFTGGLSNLGQSMTGNKTAADTVIGTIAGAVQAVFKFTDYITNSLGRITSEYGMRVHPISGQYKMHHGIDMVLSNDNIEAFTGGTVVRSGYMSNGYGYQIMIRDNKGYYHLYAHLAGNPNYQVGETVSTGSVIGVQGSSGASTGKHLHYEIRANENETNSSVDPNEYFSGGGTLAGLSGAVTGTGSGGSGGYGGSGGSGGATQLMYTGSSSGGGVLDGIISAILKFVIIFALIGVAAVFLLRAFDVDIKGTALKFATKGMIK